MTHTARIYTLRPPPLGPALGCDALDGTSELGVIESCAGAAPLALWREENPLAVDPPISPEPGSPPLAIWSGWVAQDQDPRRPSIHTWTGRGWDELMGLCDRLEPVLQARAQSLLFRPSASHVLSDPRSCLTFFNKRPSRFGLLLDPIAMLTVSMLPDAGDHLDRILDTLLDRPETRAVVVSDASAEGEQISPAPLGGGVLAPGVLDRMLSRVLESGRPVVLLGDAPSQLGVLERAGAATVEQEPRNP